LLTQSASASANNRTFGDNANLGSTPMDRDTYRKQSLDTWGEMAVGWEDRREWLMGMTEPVSDCLLDKLDPQAGQTILEIAAGTGDLGFRVAQRVGAQGRVISTDFAPEMVDVAQRQGEARGLTNVEYRVLDAECMDLGDDIVDGVVCRFGYMLMADPAAALSETRRVLRDGGRLAFAVFTTSEANPWAAVPGMTLVQLGHMPAPEPGSPGIFALAEPGRIHELVKGAGFGDPGLEQVTLEFPYRDFDDFWDFLVRVAGVPAQVIKWLPDGEQTATRAAMVQNAEPYRNEDGSYTFAASAWCVVAR
jgi:SAM-dependent methyltransferase